MLFISSSACTCVPYTEIITKMFKYLFITDIYVFNFSKQPVLLNIVKVLRRAQPEVKHKYKTNSARKLLNNADVSFYIFHSIPKMTYIDIPASNYKTVRNFVLK